MLHPNLQLPLFTNVVDKTFKKEQSVIKTDIIPRFLHFGTMKSIQVYSLQIHEIKQDQLKCFKLQVHTSPQ